MDLSGKVAVVTGAARGLGAGLARVALERGMSVALCSRSEPPFPGGDRVLTRAFDIRDADAMGEFAATAFDTFGKVDVWINNAGLLEPIGPLREVDSQALMELFNVNVLGVALGSQAYARELHARGGHGVLMNISSGAARHPYFGWSGYCASKAAVDLMSEVLAIEEEERMRVYSIAPGVIETQMQEVIRNTDERRFRDVGRFRKLHSTGKLQSPEQAAATLLDIAFNPRAQIGVCVDIRNTRG